jgi:hypothetical protein
VIREEAGALPPHLKESLNLVSVSMITQGIEIETVLLSENLEILMITAIVDQDHKESIVDLENIVHHPHRVLDLPLEKDAAVEEERIVIVADLILDLDLVTALEDTRIHILDLIVDLDLVK